MNTVTRDCLLSIMPSYDSVPRPNAEMALGTHTVNPRLFSTCFLIFLFGMDRVNLSLFASEFAAVMPCNKMTR